MVVEHSSIASPTIDYTTTMDRRRELEEKRRKLEEMRRLKEERIIALRQVSTPGPSTKDIQTPYRGNRQQVDDLLNNILGNPTPSAPPTASTSRPGSSLSSYPPKTPAPLYRNQGVQEEQETPIARTVDIPATEARPQPRNVSLQSVYFPELMFRF
jgi:hypothetical protein